MTWKKVALQKEKSEVKILYHCNLICVSPKHGMHESLRCSKIYSFTTIETYFLSPNRCETQIIKNKTGQQKYFLY